MIRPMRPQDCLAVAALHQRTLQTRLKGMAGRHLLACNYLTLAAGQGGAGYVAAEADGLVVGFVCGVWDPSAQRRALIRAHGLPLLAWGCVHALGHLDFVLDACRRTRLCSHRTRAKEVYSCATEYELRPIAVVPDRQGSGIALQLLKRLLEDASDRNFDAVVLRTEINNDRANAFYRKYGFALVRSVDGYNLYRIRLPRKDRRG